MEIIDRHTDRYTYRLDYWKLNELYEIDNTCETENLLICPNEEISRFSCPFIPEKSAKNPLKNIMDK